MTEKNDVDIFSYIEGDYALEHGCEPEVKKTWVEEHLDHLASRNRSGEELARIWDDINVFSAFITNKRHTGLSTLPHWQYSAFVQWASEIDDPAYSLRIEHVRRLMGNIRGLFEFLVDKAHIPNLREISQAYDYICGRDEVRLAELLPYAGEAYWLTARASFHSGKLKTESSFNVSDKWLLLLLASLGGSWDHLKQIASTIALKPRGTRKLAIYNLRRKLRRIGYENKPEDLLMLDCPTNSEELDKATRWFLGT